MDSEIKITYVSVNGKPMKCIQVGTCAHIVPADLNMNSSEGINILDDLHRRNMGSWEDRDDEDDE